MTTYRGIKVTPENVARDEKSPKAGIYRGTKHDAVKVKSLTRQVKEFTVVLNT